MYRDQDMKWEGQFPYDVLEPAGITPLSTIREIQDCMPYFIRQGKAGETHKARNLLRQIDIRLFFDFFFYREPLPGTGSSETGTKYEQKEKEQ
jgi:hypothetical protein